MLFYLVRHGQTDWNRAGKIQGTTDIPLNETGRQQAEQLATVLKERSGYPAKTRIDAVYASPLARAFQTAEILAKEEKLPLRRLTGLRERDFGCWEGKISSVEGTADGRHPVRRRIKKILRGAE